MYQYIKQLILLFFLLNSSFSYAQFTGQTLVEVEEGSVIKTRPLRLITTLDADQDNDQDVVGEIIPKTEFLPIQVNFNALLEDNAKNWSNLQQTPIANTSVNLTNIQGENSGATLTLKTDWDGDSQNGYDEHQSGFYPRAVTRSYYFTRGTEQLTISGLAVDQIYKFSFYASSFLEGERVTTYRIDDQQVELNAAFNTTEIVTINNVEPNENGEVTVEVAKGEAAELGFLGALVIELNQQQLRQYQLLVNNRRTPFATGLTIDEAANWAFGKAADLDRDGFPDLVAYDTEDQQLLWYKNQNGTGFTRQVIGGEFSYLSEDQIIILDLDQDEKLDILVKEGSQLFWYQQQGDSTFANRALWMESGTTDLLNAVAVRGDIDGDNLPDMIWQDGQQLFLLSSQNAYSSEEEIQVADITKPIALAVADMNGDGQSDLVVTEGYNWTGSYRIGYLENSDNGLTATPKFLDITNLDYLNLRASRLLIDDVDGDSDQDFYVYLASEACSEIAPEQTGWIENKGNWQSAEYHALGNFTAQWADIDQDGDQDLISSLGSMSGISWIENAGTAWDSLVYQSVDQTAINQIVSVVPERENGLMIGLTVQSAQSITRLAIRQGNVQSPNTLIKLNSSTASFTWADVDGDGVLELVVADQDASGSTTVQWRNSSDGLFGELAIHRGAPGANRIFVSDGLLFAPANQAGNQYGWWRWTDGDFVRSGTIDGTVTQLADLNADGAVDVLTDEAWYRNISNNQFERNTSPRGHYAVDLDGDGDIDVIDTPTDGNRTGYLNQGDGSFTSKALNVGNEPALALADLDNDGDADIVQSSASSLVWRENTDGSGTFGEEITIDDFAADWVIATDTDGDGDTDLIAYNQQVIMRYKNTFQRAENTAPEVQATIQDQTTDTDTTYQFQVPSDAFQDNDTGDVLTYSASLDDGNILPTWLTFTASSRTFSGIPAVGDTGTLTIQVQVVDSEGATASQDFNLVVVAQQQDTTTNPGDSEPPNPITSVGDELDSELLLYPNPLERGQLITVKNLPVQKLIDIQMYSTQGKALAIKLQQDSLQIESTQLTPGVYLLELKTVQQIYRRRVIVR
ncbi:MAG: FG-GAP-like repeat-containing protein [Bacteroidota bacterium]